MYGIARSLMGLLAAMALGLVPAGATMNTVRLHAATSMTHYVIRTGVTRQTLRRVHAPVRAAIPQSMRVLCPAAGC